MDSPIPLPFLEGNTKLQTPKMKLAHLTYVISGGVGRTGVFCGISIMIERLKAEGVIDVFQTVQAMRLQRPAMVQTAVRRKDLLQ